MNLFRTYIWAFMLCVVGALGVSAQEQFVQKSNLPTLYINTFNRQAVTSKTNYIYATLYYVDEQGVTQYDSLQIRGRGNSTWGLAKKPYRIKFQEKTRILGPDRAKAKSWTLLANHADKTLMRNAVASYIGKFMGQPFTAGAQFVDLVLNGSFLGCYQLSDQVEIRKGRVHIQEQDEVLTDTSNITGGYLLEVDGFATGEPVYYRTNKNILVTIKSPDSEVIVSSQKDYIRNHMQKFEDALFSSRFADAQQGYRPYVDSLTLASWYMATELTGNVDGFWSTYMYKKPDDQKFYWGPLWDYDIALNNCNRVGDVTNHLMINKGFGSDLTKVWMLQMWKDPWFVQLINRSWKECIDRGLEDSVIHYVDSMAMVLEQSQILNFAKWPINQRVYNEITLYSTYQEGVDYMKDFLHGHIAFLSETFKSEDEDMDGVEEEAPELEVDENFYYRILNKGNGNAIDVTDSHGVCTWSPVYDREEQQWEFIPLKSGYYQIVNRATGMALTDVAVSTGTSYTPGSQLVVQELRSSSRTQHWAFEPITTGNSYVIVNRQTNLALNNSGGSGGNGAQVLSWKNDADNSKKNTRQWRIEKYEPKPGEVDGIEEHSHVEPYVVVYNPVLQQICFAIEQGTDLSDEAVIYDLRGRAVMQFSTRQAAKVNSLPRGTYVLKWTESGHQRAVKFMKL